MQDHEGLSSSAPKRGTISWNKANGERAETRPSTAFGWNLQILTQPDAIAYGQNLLFSVALQGPPQCSIVYPLLLRIEHKRYSRVHVQVFSTHVMVFARTVLLPKRRYWYTQSPKCLRHMQSSGLYGKTRFMSLLGLQTDLGIRGASFYLQPHFTLPEKTSLLLKPELVGRWRHVYLGRTWLNESLLLGQYSAHGSFCVCTRGLHSK